MFPAIGPEWNAIGLGLANHLWQSTIFMIIAGTLTLLFRWDSAVVRYRLWLTASLKFLVPFSLIIGIGSGIGSQLGSHRTGPFIQSSVPIVFRQIGQPFVAPPVLAAAPSPAAPPTSGNSMALIIGSVWIIGTLSVLRTWWLKWTKMSGIVRNAKTFDASSLLTPFHREFPPIAIRISPAGLEPGVFGIFRPVLLLPEGAASNLGRAQLRSIIAHEMFHVRGRDNLASALHMIVEAVFWFHPLVWWLGNRLIDERERACDEAVLQLGCEPADYAEGILTICKCYVKAPACVAGVSGSNLRKRIEDIMNYQGTHKLVFGRRLLLAFVGAAIPAVLVLTGIVNPGVIRAGSVLAGPAPVYESAAKVAESVLHLAPVRAPQPTPERAPATIQAPAVLPAWSADDVSLIITDAERLSFDQLQTDVERETFVSQFWLQRDPTPGTAVNEFRDEFYARIAYANDHFKSQSGIPGSKTDRGKMYILNGTPDEIVSHPTRDAYTFPVAGGRSTSTFPFETWRYRHIDGKGDNIVYEFVDQQLNGDYRLEYNQSEKLR